MNKAKIGFPIEYEDENNIVRNGLFLREPEIEELEKRLKEINKITNLKQQVKKQKEVIGKAIEYIKENCAQSYCLPPKIYDVRCLDLNALLEILEDKEVSE